MDLSGLLALLREGSAYRALLAELADPLAGSRRALALLRAARPYFIAALAQDVGRPLLIITARPDHAASLAEQVRLWAPDLRVLAFAEPNAVFYERAPWGQRAIRARLQVLAELAGLVPTTSHVPAVVVTSAKGLMHRTLPPAYLLHHCTTVRQGEHLPAGGRLEGLLRLWLQIGYEPVTLVTEPGTFSRRGGIVDVFPLTADQPVRIELWGEEVESLRTFDPATQRSLTTLDAVTIPPAREALPLYGLVAASRLKAWVEALPAPEADVDAAVHPRADWEALRQQQAFDALEFYLPWMTEEVVSLLDYLPPHALVLVDDWEELADAVADLESQALGLREAHVQAGDIPPDMPLPYVTWSQIADDLAQKDVLELGGTGDLYAEQEDRSGQIGTLFAPGPRYAGELRYFLDCLHTLARRGQERLIIVSRQAERLADLWRERLPSVPPVLTEALVELPPAGVPIFVRGTLAEGWLLRHKAHLTHLFTDAEIFGWKRPEPRRRPERRAIAPEDFFADLTPGDYVVHAEFGIGHFQGLEKRTLDGIEREFLVIHYAGGDVLYVPIHQADRLTRYVGVDDEPPELSRLGTAEWSRVKERARQAVEEVARDLLELYALREAVSGHAFSPDTPWQRELEASFPYVETPDQLRALAEVKADMEKPRPMDRLICGDVGYGKTEVALRAAFKAVMDGKQVAMLVPTTVLAQQHYETFSQRLAPFPVRVEMLSRFRSPAEQEEVLAGLATGTVDIVIGTHRLLSSDVRFKDLGLLIIDEEQRFGVTHKEQLKRMRVEVDVLTLTATPIPRTLYMSLSGVRDISIIETAPEERLPVRTYVGQRDDNLIRLAILRELDRGGQVFFVHNRVETIYAEKQRLEQLVPEATFAVAHGQMPEALLEAVMQRFVAGEVDVLVCTSIIEAGLDIPNANTLIVDRADRFGLAQLYQLRGRVGRSTNRAFAYFFHPPLSRLTPEARARLQTIAEQTELGSGFHIAMRDLEIRGAGELLGVRQSGHISAVGFHLYTRMLAQAVKRLRDQHEGTLAADGGPLEAPAPRETVAVELPLPTYIPTDYVPSMTLRLQLYRRMAELRSEAAIEDLRAELQDRFGPLPLPVENLLYQLRVKLLALEANVETIAAEGAQIAIRLSDLEHIDRPALQRWLGHNVRVSRTAIWLPCREDWQAALIAVLKRLAAARVRMAAD